MTNKQNVYNDKSKFEIQLSELLLLKYQLSE